MAYAKASIGTANYAVAIKAGHHELNADEGPALGGQDVGPAPYELLASALAACTAITLRMYAERKQWPLQGVQVAIHFKKEAAQSSIERLLTLQGPLSDEQRQRLADIAERTPVTLTLKSSIQILTHLV